MPSAHKVSPSPLLQGLSRLLSEPTAFWLAVVAYATLIVMGGKRFLLWPQITDLWGASVWEAVIHLHPHAPRLFLMQPVLWLAKHGVDRDLAFSGMCVLCLVVGAFLIAKAAGTALSKDFGPLRLPAFIGLALLALTMGGRMIPAFTAVAVLLAVHRRPPSLAWNLAAHAAALLLASVSSGSISVIIVLVLLSGLSSIVNNWGTQDPWWRWISGTAFAVLVLTLLAVVMVYADKALRSFDGDVWALFTQGWGTAILGIRERAGSGPTIILLLGGILWVAWWTWCGGRTAYIRPDDLALNRMERAALTVPFIVGLTGFNSWSLIIPAAILACLVWWHRPPPSRSSCLDEMIEID